MKVIAFVGYPLSGKSTAAQVAREVGIPVVVMGDIVREEAARKGFEPTDENLGKIASELREREGMDAIAKRCIPRIREVGKKSGIVVVDGIRGIAEVERFKKAFGDDFILIAIESPLEVRFGRAKVRRRSDDVKRLEDLEGRDRREERWGMREAMEIADFTIENTGDYEDFVDKVRQILLKLTRNVEIEIETEVHPTESVEKVVNAIRNLFPDADVRIEDGKLRGRARNLERFRELLRRQRILDTARSELIKGRSGKEITVYLNKQTATVSRINFCDPEAILSPLRVTFRLNNVPFQRFLDYIAPETRNGRPVKELEKL